VVTPPAPSVSPHGSGTDLACGGQDVAIGPAPATSADPLPGDARDHLEVDVVRVSVVVVRCDDDLKEVAGDGRAHGVADGVVVVDRAGVGAALALLPVLEDVERAPVLELEVAQVDGEPAGVSARSRATPHTRARPERREVPYAHDAGRAEARHPLGEGGDEAAVHDVVHRAATFVDDLDATDLADTDGLMDRLRVGGTDLDVVPREVREALLLRHVAQRRLTLSERRGAKDTEQEDQRPHDVSLARRA